MGLPGAGKTTLARQVLAEIPGAVESRVPRVLPALLAFRADRPARAWVRSRFSRVLSLLPPASRADAAHRIARVAMERAILRVESRVTRRHTLVDEGFWQRGLGIALRAPAAMREAVWSEYVKSVPPGAAIMLVGAPVEVAAERALMRPNRRVWGSVGSQQEVRASLSQIQSLLDVIEAKRTVPQREGRHDWLEVGRPKDVESVFGTDRVVVLARSETGVL